jgi:excisionase family DNA binding protein
MAGPLDFDACGWLTPEQVAEKLGLPLETITAWRTQGKGPPWAVVGGEVCYGEADFRRWLGEMTGG